MKLMRTIQVLGTVLVATAVAVGCGAGSAGDPQQAEAPAPASPSEAGEPAPPVDVEQPPAEPVAEPTTEEEATPPASSPPPAPVPPRRCKPETGGEQGVYTNLVDVRVGTHAGYDRITFEFRAPKPNVGGKTGIPRYEIRAARPPFTQDGSGSPLAVSGSAFINLVFHGASGVDPNYRPTYHGPTVFRPGFDVLREAVRSGDFEATLGWVLGLNRQTCWNVLELHGPDRVVLDVPHS